MSPHLRSQSDGNDAESSHTTESFLIKSDEESSNAETDVSEKESLDDADWHVKAQDLPDMIQDGHPPEYYHRIANEIDETALATSDYSPGTQSLLDAGEEDWKRFCRENAFGDYNTCLKSISCGVLKSFFTWRLDIKSGKGGRTLKGIKTVSSLGLHWKVFRLVYTRATGTKLDATLNHQMHQVLRGLAEDRELSTKKRENRCMTIDDLKEQIEETLATTGMSFGLGEHRILAVLFLLLLAPAGARPTAILKLRFGDIRVVLESDPKGGPHKLLLQFTPEFTKKYLGKKDAKTFTVPETLFDPTLILSPHVFLLGVLFRHEAFRAPLLTSASCLQGLYIHPGERELRLPLRQDLKNVPLFRRAVKTPKGLEMSLTDSITYGMMSGWIKRVGQLLGRLHTTICYSLRYNAGNELDGSSYASDAIRNLALDHSSSAPFQKHYLARQLRLDTWAIIRGQTPQQELLKQACSIGHANSKRRPTSLTADQTALINTDRRVKELEKRVRLEPPRSEERQKAVRAVRQEKDRLKKALLNRIRGAWTDEQAVEDIQLQLQGHKFTESTTRKPVCSPFSHPERKRLIEALTAPMNGGLERYYDSRNAAINAIATYCSVIEGRIARQTHGPRSTQSSPDSPAPCSLEASHLKDAMLSVFAGEGNPKPRRCFLCVSSAAALKPNDPQVEALIHEFYTPGDLSKHFRRRHLNTLAEESSTRCDVCEVDLECKMDLRSHAKKVHGTLS